MHIIQKMEHLLVKLDLNSLKSLGLALVWQRTDRTLNDEEINQAFEGIVTALNKKFGANIRS